MNKLLILASLWALAVGVTHAATCSEADAAKMNALQESPEIVSACGPSSQWSQSSTSAADIAKICSNKPCITAVRAMIPKLPDCTINGHSFASLVSMGLDQCEKIDTSGSSNNKLRTPTSAAPTTIPTTMSLVVPAATALVTIASLLPVML